MRTPLTRLSCKRATSEQCFPPFWTGRRVWRVDEYRRAGPGSSLGKLPILPLSHSWLMGFNQYSLSVVTQSKLFEKSE